MTPGKIKATRFPTASLRRALFASALVGLMGWCLPLHADSNGAASFIRKPGSPGELLFKGNCSACHDHGVDHAPPQSILMLMSASTIHEVLVNGPMKNQGSALSEEQKVTIAEYLAGAPMGAGAEQPSAPRCAEADAKFDFSEPPVFPGWGLTEGNTRHITQQQAGLDRSALPRLHLKWAFGFNDSLRARSHPALAGGAVFIGSNNGKVFALDRKSGCIRWQFQGPAEIRTGIVVSPWKAGDSAAAPMVFFGDLIGNIYGLDARNGALIWKDHADDHPSTTITAAPSLANGKLYVSVSSLEEANIASSYECCTFRGSVIAYDALTGNRVWKTYMLDQPPHPDGVNAKGAKKFAPSGASVWNTPSIDEKRGQLTIGTGNDYSGDSTRSDSVVALDLASGKIKWVHQVLAKDAWNASCSVKPRALCPKVEGPDHDFGAATILTTTSDGHDMILAGAKSGEVFALDPDSGKELWQTKIGRGGIMAGIYFGMAVSGDTLFVPISDLPDGRNYKEPAKPGLYALDIKTGKFLWKQPASAEDCTGRPMCAPGIAAAISATPDLVLSGGIDGRVRIRDGASGQELWQYDTAQSFDTVGGGKATGGSIGGGAAPIAYHGMLFVSSGYGFATQRPGNVFLVFDSAEEAGK